MYPSENLFPSSNLFPDRFPFKFLILRFKLYQNVAEDDATYDDLKIISKFTGAQYLQAIPLNKKGYVDLKIKYERG